jgi:hypothetical protein
MASSKDGGQLINLSFQFTYSSMTCTQCFHLQGFFPAARKYWSLQGICKEMSFTWKWQGKIQKLKDIARISVTYTSYKSKTT